MSQLVQSGKRNRKQAALGIALFFIAVQSCQAHHIGLRFQVGYPVCIVGKSQRGSPCKFIVFHINGINRKLIP